MSVTAITVKYSCPFWNYLIHKTRLNVLPFNFRLEKGFDS